MNTDSTHDATNAGPTRLVVDIRHISAEQLAVLGLGGLAYVKPVTTAEGIAFAIHAADGSPMALVPAQDVAIAAIMQHEMVPALVH